MNFDFTADQQDIKRTARDLLASRSSLERVREAAEAGTPDAALWAELRELGWPGIAIAEQHGGQGLGMVELAILLEEIGYACAVTPLLGTVLAAAAIEHGGTDAQRARWLPGLAAGEITGALGPADGLIADAPGAGVVVAVDGEGAARLVDPAAVEPVATIDPTRAYGRLRDAGAAGEPLGADAAAGISQRALEMTAAYVKERKQFGTPVGAFQAVSHRCAQMLLHTESARSATYFAAWAADADPRASAGAAAAGGDGGDPRAAGSRVAEAASLAKAAASEAGREVTASAIQAHGGIGFTWEADVHWFYKRAQLDAGLLGGSAAHRARLARALASRAGSVAAA